MWSDILSLFKGAGLSEAAFEQSLLMLEESHGMFKDCVAALHTEGALVADIYERDRQINKYERSVRRKIVTHMSVSSKPDINIGLVLTAIVIDIERIGDYTKNIAELAATLEEPFDALELNEDVEEIETSLDGMFGKVAVALKESDEAGAREVMKVHARVSELVEADILRLRRREVLKGRSGHAVTVGIYLRFLKRVSAHLKNVATSVVNPYHRIGFREKDAPLGSK
jgi:phosphate uptake regulator